MLTGFFFLVVVAVFGGGLLTSAIAACASSSSFCEERELYSHKLHMALPFEGTPSVVFLAVQKAPKQFLLTNSQTDDCLEWLVKVCKNSIKPSIWHHCNYSLPFLHEGMNFSSQNLFRYSRSYCFAYINKSQTVSTLT